MKKIIIYSSLIFLLLGCSKDINQVKELDIHAIEIDFTDQKQNTSDSRDYVIYPNPFSELVFFAFINPAIKEVFISNLDGDFKTFIIESNYIAINFSNEKSGVYYCEILTDNSVFRTKLIKE